MNQLITTGIVLSRTNFGEADRIITVLTPDHGKLRLMAKGVRKVKSKLAGGIELFSISNITFIQGRGEVGTLISTRLIKYYDSITKDITRVQLGYELIKILSRATEDEPEVEYFNLLDAAFAALDDVNINALLIQAWFSAQLLKLAGHTPNLDTDTSGRKLEATEHYEFNYDDKAFSIRQDGGFTASHIKFLRLMFSASPPHVLQQVQGVDSLMPVCAFLVQTVSKEFIRS